MHLSIVRTAVLLLLAFSSSFALAAAPPEITKIGADVEAQLQTTARATVVVVFEPSSTSTAQNQTEARRASIASRANAVLASLPADHYTLRRRFDNVAALSLDIDAAALAALRADASVIKVDLDVGGRAQLLQAAPLAHVSNVRSRGFVGNGVKTAVIDSGVQLNHVDLADSIVGQQCFCSGDTPGVGCCPNGADTQSGAGSGADAEGHGTNVSGIITGNGTQAPQGGAPGASLVIVRVLDANGSFRTSSDIVAALDWIASNHANAKVVNMSVGTDMLFAGACDSATSWAMALAQAANAVAGNGTLMTSSSGNQASPTSISAPACLTAVMAVGAVWDAPMPAQTFLGCTDSVVVADKPTCFTNSNTSVALYAPGAYTTATGLDIDPFTSGFSSTYGGTSQAAPLVASCIADLFQFKPNLTRERVKAALLASPTRVTDPKNGLSFPRLDCESALIEVDRIFAGGFD